MMNILILILAFSLIANVGQYVFALQLDRRKQVADANVDHAISELGSSKRRELKLQASLSSVRADLERAHRRMSTIEAKLQARNTRPGRHFIFPVEE